MLLGHGEFRRVLIFLIPDETLPMGHFDDVVASLHRAPLPSPSHGVCIRHRLGSKESSQRTPYAELLGQGPGVDTLDSRNAILLQVGRQRLIRPPVAHPGTQFPDHKPRAMSLIRLHVLKVDARVANHRVGHRHDLPLVGGIGQDFLIAGHRGVETHLPGCRSLRSKSVATEHRTVFKGENRVH